MAKGFKLFFSFFVMGSIIFTLSGCFKKKHGSLSDIKGPCWLFDPYCQSKNPKDLLAVGIAPYNPLSNIKIQIDEAEHHARANLATLIKTEVSRLTVNETERGTIADSHTIKINFSDRTEEIVNALPLSGSLRKELWRTEEAKDVYVLMYIDRDKVADYLKHAYELQSNDKSMPKARKNEVIKARNNIVENFRNEDSIAEYKGHPEKVTTVNEGAHN